MRKKWQLSSSKRPPGIVYDPVHRERDPDEDPAHLKWIRSLPCVVLAHPLLSATRCQFRVHAHHPTGAGQALRDGDLRAVPLCLGHHAERHEFRGSFEGWSNDQAKRWEAALADLYGRLGELRKELSRE